MNNSFAQSRWLVDYYNIWMFADRCIVSWIRLIFTCQGHSKSKALWFKHEFTHVKFQKLAALRLQHMQPWGSNTCNPEAPTSWRQENSTHAACKVLFLVTTRNFLEKCWTLPANDSKCVSENPVPKVLLTYTKPMWCLAHPNSPFFNGSVNSGQVRRQQCSHQSSLSFVENDNSCQTNKMQFCFLWNPFGNFFLHMDFFQRKSLQDGTSHAIAFQQIF